MSSVSGPSISTDGLVFYYDTTNTRESWKGAPTTNYINGPSDFSNVNWDSTTYPVTVTVDAAWAPDYTFRGDLVVNTGLATALIFQTESTTTIGTGQQTCSVYVKEYSASYFTFNCFYSGDTEVNIKFYPSTGVCDAGGTMTYVGDGWYRCSITVPARVGAGTSFFFRIWPGGRNLANTLGCYFWGAQLENGSFATPLTPQTRSNTGALIDMTGNYTITANSLTYASNNTFSLNGTTDYMTVSMPNPFAETVITWVKSATSTWNEYGWISSARTQNGHIIHPTISTKAVEFYIADSTPTLTLMGSVTPTDITIPRMYCYTTNGSNSHKYYLDGQLAGTSTTAITRTAAPTAQTYYIGRDSTLARYGNGNIYIVMRYERQLSDSEILGAFVAFRQRFGV